MTLAKLLSLVRINLARDRKGVVFSAFGVAVGIGALVFFVGLGGGVGRLVRERIFPSDSRAVEVVPSALSFGGVLGGGRLDDATIARFSALPGVEKVFRKMEVRVPAMGGPAEGLVQTFRVPRHVYLAILATGVDPEYVAGDLAPGVTFADPPEGKPVPAIAARRLIELYNRSFARSQGLAPISEQLLLAAANVELLNVHLGRSMRGDTGMPQRDVGFSFGGISDRAPLQGVLVPLETARRLNKLYGLDAETYSSAAIVAKSPGDVPGIVKQVKEMGFTIDDSEKKLSESVGGAVAVTTGALALLSALICLLAGVNIAHALSASVRTRAKEIGLLRAVGATRGDIMRLVLGEASVIGFLGGAAGTLAAWGLATALDTLARTHLPEFPFKPDTFFRFPPALLGGAVVLGVLAALLGALLPALAASRTDPARALAG